MNQTSLKEAMEHINITEEMQRDILGNVRRRQRGRQYRTNRGRSVKKWKKTLSIAAAALLAVGIISIPVQAGIRYLIRERMENLPQEEVEAISEMMTAQDTHENGDGDSFSRDYTPSELSRRAELFKAYQNGTFPEGELVRITDETQRDSEILCYDETCSLFYLPDRELTDEELLQIIDFNYKRDYVLEQAPGVQEVRTEQEKEQKRLSSQVAKSGGVDEAKAIEMARSWMDSLFATSPDGMELNSYLTDSHFEIPAWCVNFSIQSNCYYYFWINAQDGSLLRVDVSRADRPGAISADKVGEQARSAYSAARDFLESKLDIQENYEAVHCFYYLVDNREPGTLFQFYFIRDDGQAYNLSVYGENSEVTGFTVTTEEDYRQVLERAQENEEHTLVMMELE